MIAYKYRSDYQRDVLSLVNNQIFAGSLNNLNDPFEGMIDARDLDLFSLIFKSDSANLDKEFVAFKKTISEKGIYCLSQINTNEVMWSLYADSHKGFCIEYDIDILLNIYNFYKNRPLAHILKLKYQNTVPKNLFTDIIIRRDFKDILQGFAGIKSKAWEYEKEVRIINESAGLIDYDFKAVKAIYFGVRATKLDIENTMKSLGGRGIKFYQMKLKPYSYSLEAEEIVSKKISLILYKQNQIEYSHEFLSEKNLLEFYKYRHQFKVALDHIAQIPNIVSIDSIDFDEKEDEPFLNVFATINILNFEYRFIQVKWKDGNFYFDN